MNTSNSLLDLLLGNALLLTILLMLGLAIIGAVLKARRRDPCLNSFSRYLVYVRLKNGKQIWGELITDATGIELHYRADHLDPQGHVESSYIIFNGEFPNIYMIIRYLDELTPRNAQRRQKTLDRSYRPNILRRTRRKIRNWYNLLRDAVSQAMAALLTAVTKTAPAAVVDQQKTVTGTGQEVVQWFGNAYDPILERHIGGKVVVEVASPDGDILEFVGVFREYSSDYLEVMDVTFNEDGRDRQVDLVIPRKHSTVRHNAESTGRTRSAIEDPTEPEKTVQV